MIPNEITSTFLKMGLPTRIEALASLALPLSLGSGRRLSCQSHDFAALHFPSRWNFLINAPSASLSDNSAVKKDRALPKYMSKRTSLWSRVFYRGRTQPKCKHSVDAAHHLFSSFSYSAWQFSRGQFFSTMSCHSGGYRL